MASLPHRAGAKRHELTGGMWPSRLTRGGVDFTPRAAPRAPKVVTMVNDHSFPPSHAERSSRTDPTRTSGVNFDLPAPPEGPLSARINWHAPQAQLYSPSAELLSAQISRHILSHELRHAEGWIAECALAKRQQHRAEELQVCTLQRCSLPTLDGLPPFLYLTPSRSTRSSSYQLHHAASRANSSHLHPAPILAQDLLTALLDASRARSESSALQAVRQ